MTQQVVNKVVLKHLFMQYPFKKNIPTKGNIIPVPYVKKDDIVFNEFTLDYSEWFNIIRRYISLCKEVLLSGNVLDLPFKMGRLQIKKVKMRKFLDKKKSAESGSKVYNAKPNPDGMYLDLVWDRNYKICFLSFKWHWNIIPNRALIREAYKRCENDYTYIHKFQDK